MSESYKETDFTAFVKLLNALAAELGGQVTNEAAQLEYESWLHRDLTGQRVVVRDPQDPPRLLAYADFWTISARGEANFALGVLREAWGRGLEETLLGWLVTQVKPLGMKKANMFAPGNAKALQAFLEERGFVEAGAYRQLVLEPLPHLQEVAFPEGYTLHAYAELDDAILFQEAARRSFADLWGHTASEEGHEQEAAWRGVLEHYDPQHLYVLLHEGSAAGCLRFRRNGEEGYLDSPGLAPEHRRPDLYRALALTGVQGLGSAGAKRVVMDGWGEPDEAVRSYEALGFEQTVLELGYQLTL